MSRETRQLACALFLLLALSAFALPAAAETGTAVVPVFQAQPDEFPGGGNSCRIPPPFQPESCICPLIFDPVCGCDGQTYSNACFARCQVRSFTPGACE